jgi:Asp-tRNA(Asn)/Glu-tRNA(Gln) amidotransferase B subunit
MEIVTAPDMHSGAEAAAFARHLIDLLRALDVCDGKLEGA